MHRANLETNQRRCGECGIETPTDELVNLGSIWVCARCKPRAVSKIREGAPVGGADRDQPHVHRDRVRLPYGRQLPNRCVICNGPAATHLNHRFSPHFPLWLLPLTLAPFVGLSLRNWVPEIGLTGGTAGLFILVAAVILHPLLTPRPPLFVSVAICRNHHRSRRLWLRSAAAAVLLGLVGIGSALIRFHSPAVLWDWIYGPAFILSVGALALWARLRVVALEPGPGRSLEIRGTGAAFRASLARVYN